MFKRLIPDTFVLVLMGVVLVALMIPANGRALDAIAVVSNTAIFSLFFFHGLKLAQDAVWAGIRHWRLQLAVLVCTFGAMPLFGLGASSLLGNWLSPELWLGVLFLCVLPSTVQSAIAYSSMAGGNVAASLVAAATSNLLGVVLTPLLFTAMVSIGGDGIGLASVGKVALLLLLPFGLGQVARRWLANWAERHRAWIGRMDRLTIVLAVYVAFSAATNEGVWSQLSAAEMLALLGVVTLLLALAFWGCWMLGGWMGLSRADRITLFYSGSHKSLATGAPMARILFPAAQAGLIIIPLMLYHQLQLIVSAWLAGRFNRST